jgi:hypothetical protein
MEENIISFVIEQQPNLNKNFATDFGEIDHTSEEDKAIHRLLLAVLDNAIRDAIGKPSLHKVPALRWIQGQVIGYPGLSFELVCEALGIRETSQKRIVRFCEDPQSAKHSCRLLAYR